MKRTYTRWRSWNRRRSFSRSFKREADRRLAAGEMSPKEHEKALEAANDPEKMRRVVRELEVNPEALGGIDWGRIRDWIVKNWPQILRFVLSIAILLLDDNEE